MNYELVKNKPAAKFFYRGTHSHPIKRTVLITEQNQDWIKGYEVREGSVVREVADAPIKTFSREKVATTSQLRADNPLKNKKDACTLERMSMTALEKAGI